MAPDRRVSPRSLWDIHGEHSYEDQLITEAPLELWLQGAPHVLMMRTPGCDVELVTGLLWSSGVIDEVEDVLSVTPCPRSPQTRIDVSLESGVQATPRPRRGYLSSSCGLCSLEDAQAIALPPLQVATAHLPAEQLLTQLESLNQGMVSFKLTGGCHGALLVDLTGNTSPCFEDVGRHNAVDKALGWALQSVPNLSPRGEGEAWGLAGWSLVVSSRAGFEVIHKAASCGVSAVICMGASSSLAHDYAQATGLTLYSFARASRAHRHSRGSLT